MLPRGVSASVKRSLRLTKAKREMDEKQKRLTDINEINSKDEEKERERKGVT